MPYTASLSLLMIPFEDNKWTFYGETCNKTVYYVKGNYFVLNEMPIIGPEITECKYFCANLSPCQWSAGRFRLVLNLSFSAQSEPNPTLINISLIYSVGRQLRETYTFWSSK